MNVIFLRAYPPYVAGQVADVSAGYAQNFLIPKGIAKPATEQARATARAQAAIVEKRAAEQAKALQELALVLQGATVRITVKASPAGRLYAALTPKVLANNIEAQVHCVLPDDVRKRLPTLKTRGTHTVALPIFEKQVTFTIEL